MKKALLVLGLLAGLACSSFAQPAHACYQSCNGYGGGYGYDNYYYNYGGYNSPYNYYYQGGGYNNYYNYYNRRPYHYYNGGGYNNYGSGTSLFFGIQFGRRGYRW